MTAKIKNESVEPQPEPQVVIQMSPAAADVLRQVIALQNVQVGSENFVNTSIRLAEAHQAIIVGLQQFIDQQNQKD